MKKLIIIILALVLTLSLASCGEPSNTGSKTGGSTAGENNNGGNKTYTATVTPPTGWKVVAAEYPLIQYGNDNADGFWIRKPTTGKTLSEAVTSYKDVEAANKSITYTWEDVKDVKVNTYDAKNLTYTGSYSGVDLRYAVYFVEKEGNVFIIVCQSQTGQYDAVKADFDAFLASFTISEK